MSKYDAYVTGTCPAAWDSGWRAGLLADYLTEEATYDGEAESHWTAGYEQGVAERIYYTAEDLLLMAYEYEYEYEFLGAGPAVTMANLRFRA